ncbi:MAG: hypothetical protein H0T76_01060 [Nannocystis sp.]|nr:hypothetical protein [Nannocystis sp.]MBA3545050.1 hypothetical protein [Nannocystis sp.]
MIRASHLPYVGSLTLGAVLLLACGDGGSGSNTDAGTTDAGTSGTTASGTDGSGSDTGSGTDAPTTGGTPELDPRLTDCLRINACEADGGSPMGLQRCIGHALDVPWLWASVGSQRLDIEAMTCKLAAADCAGVRACTPPLAGFAETCKEKAGTDLCVDSTWVICDPLGAPLTAMDCAAAGLACDVDIWAGCGLEPCEYGVTEASCEGDVLVECAPSGFMARVDCPTQYNYVKVSGPEGEETFSIAGETCGFDEMRGALGCIGTGEVCDFFSQACDGDELETCAGGKLSRRDCGALEPGGQSCGFVQSGPFAGVAACGLVDAACDLGANEACDASTISFCDWDTPGTVDCLAAGYTGCATAEQGPRTIAYCTP